MNDFKTKVRCLERQRQNEITAIADKYRELIANVYLECTHEYGDWFTRYGTVIPDTNIHGTYFEHKKCKLCGKEETRLKDFVFDLKIFHENN